MLRIRFSPYTTASLSAKLVFTTSVPLSSESSKSEAQQSEFPFVPTTHVTMDLIKPVLDLVIVNRDSDPFLRPVDPIIDRAPQYFETIKHPIDLSLIRQKALAQSYTEFGEFISDMSLMFANALTYNPPANEVYQCAVRLSQLFKTLLAKVLGREPGNPFKSVDSNAAEKRITEAIQRLARRKRDLARASEARASDSHSRGREPSTMGDYELRQLIQNISELHSSALIGVMEIISKKPFDASAIPFSVDLTQLNHETVGQLNTYIAQVKRSAPNLPQPLHDKCYYAWRPHLPTELQEIRDQYEADLAEWRKPVEASEVR
jgi:hypothetical protein